MNQPDAINGDVVLASRRTRLNQLRQRFRSHYGDGPISLWRAPARINILGEHVDYVSYLPTASLPFASREHEMLMLYRATPDKRVRGASTHDAYVPFAFDLRDGPPPSDSAEQAWLAYLINSRIPAPHWSNYVKGAAFFAGVKYGEQIRHGIDFLIDSNIPPSGGASSSSALTVLAGAALREVNHIHSQPDELARESAQAEWFLGTRGGAMDHMTICLAKRHRAVHISYPDHHSELAPLPGDGFRWVTFFTHAADKGREVMLEYNERAAVSRLLIPAMIGDWRRDRPALAEAWADALKRMNDAPFAALDQLESLLAELPAQITFAEVACRNKGVFAECELAFPTLLAARREQPLKLRDRARHHVTETRRVAEAVRLLRATFDEDAARATEPVNNSVRQLGALINASHESLRDLYDVSTPEVEELVSILRADANVYGARLMGGGFGGNLLALTKVSHVTQLIERAQAEFYDLRGRNGINEGAVMVSTSGDGLSR